MIRVELRKISFHHIIFSLTWILLFHFSVQKITALEPPINQATITQVTTEENHPRFVLFLNQVRGDECCDKGSLEHLQSQLDTFKNFKTPATFAIRYDALNDPRYIQLLQSPASINSTTQHELALFLEITPSLAKESGVEYHGTESNWYQAQYAYTVGYSNADRQKLADTAMEKFKAVFGSYPKTTVGWIMDTFTINYLREKYGVFIHQITREQWGTDSYTMSGGPIHYPYFADQNWSFLPALNNLTTQPLNNLTAEQPNSLTAQLPNPNNILILRQTISDPLRNYGDTTSAFTSQPNDYSRDKKNLNYFKKLFDQAMDQKHNAYSIAILGLENSMTKEYQDEYVKHIEYATNKQSVTVTTPIQLLNSLTAQPLTQPIPLVIGHDLINDTNTTAYWITTPYYRVRILRDHRKVSLTDFRLYRSTNDSTLNNSTTQQPNNSLQDPYQTYAAQNLGYWVAPFLIDGSRFYEKETVVKLPWHVQLKDALKAKILPEYRFPYQSLPESQNDLTTQPMALTLPPIHDDAQISVQRLSPESVQLEYQTDQKPVTLTFTTTDVKLDTEKAHDAITFHSFEKLTPQIMSHTRDTGKTLLWQTDGADAAQLQLSIDCPNSHHCTLKPQIHFSNTQDWHNFQQQFYPYLFPEVVDRPISSEKSTLYVHNRFAIAGRNPIRIVYVPKDEHGYPIQSDTPLNIITTPNVGEILTQPQQGHDGLTFIDVIENRVGKYQLEFQLANQSLKTQTIYFAPDCKKQKLYCLTHPIQGFWFLLSSLQTRIREW